MDLKGAAKFAALWWAIDMAAPIFAHQADDVQASIAEMAVAKATRPSPQEIIAFATALEGLVPNTHCVDGEDFIILSTKFEPEGLLAEAIKQSGRTPNVHHLSWFKRMKITQDGRVYISKFQDSKGSESWMLIHGEAE